MLDQTSCQLRDVRNGTNNGSFIPHWVHMQMSGDVASNGTFLIVTPVGTARVHLGNVVIEHQGQLWSRSPEEAPQLIGGFDAEASLPIAAIGPGKATQFGTKSKAGKGRARGGERKIGLRPPIGEMPSIEWVHTTELGRFPFSMHRIRRWRSSWRIPVSAKGLLHFGNRATVDQALSRLAGEAG